MRKKNRLVHSIVIFGWITSILTVGSLPGRAGELILQKPFGFETNYQTGSTRSSITSEGILHVIFPAMLFGPHESGFNFGARLSPKISRTISYEVKLGRNFDFVLGGKLPGLCGGKDATGGLKSDHGFSSRVMWRRDGKLVAYVYHRHQIGKYGDDFDWNHKGQKVFIKRDVWHSIKLVVTLNSLGQRDGSIKVSYNGEIVLEKSDFSFREESGVQIDKLCFNSFYGGNDSSWAPQKDQELWIRNLIVD